MRSISPRRVLLVGSNGLVLSLTDSTSVSRDVTQAEKPIAAR